VSRCQKGEVGVLELVVSGESEADPFSAIPLAALTDELPGRRVIGVDLRCEVANAAIHLVEQIAHDMLLKSRLE
jgi:hypothetical protein